MARSTVLLLQDILDAANAIAAYTHDGKAAFDQNPMIRDAVIARLIQIGQAVKNLAAEGLNLAALKPEIPWRSAARTRDRIAHHYWAIEPRIIWLAVEELPRLATAARELLEKEQPSPRPRSRRRGKR